VPPRIRPLNDGEMNEQQHELTKAFVQNGRLDNVFRTIVQHPDLLRRWTPYVKHILFKSTLSSREREILILRTGYLCRSEYEWAQHVRGGKNAGLSDADIACIMNGRGLSPREDVLLRATDDLHERSRISDANWTALAGYYDHRQLIDVVFTVGQYNMIAMALNSFGVEVDDHLSGYPELPAQA
jgi:4-carboxymuconolactone decarboxylase